MTPDLLLDQGQSAEMSSEEEQFMQTIHNILRQGYVPTCDPDRAQMCFSCHNAMILNDYIDVYLLHIWLFSPSLRTNESDVVIKHKAKAIFQKIQNLKVCPFLLGEGLSLHWFICQVNI